MSREYRHTSITDPERVAAVRRLQRPDARAGRSFDRLARLAATFLDGPIALVSVLELDRQISYGSFGLQERFAAAEEVIPQHTFCRYVVESGEPLVVPNACDHPLTRSDPGLLDTGIVAYIGVPLTTPGGIVLGSFSVVDFRPRDWTPGDVAVLVDLAGSVYTEIELRQELVDRSEAEAQYTAAEAHYRRLVTRIPEAVYVLDQEGRFTELNPAAERILNQPAGDLLNQRFSRVVSPPNLASVEAAFATLMSGRENDLVIEAWFGTPDRQRLLSITATAIERHGAIVGVHGIARDVTEIRDGERALRESEEKFRQIAENVREVFWVFTPDFSRTLYMGPLYEEIWGRPVSELYSDSRAFMSSVHPDDREALLAAMAAVSQNRVTGIEYRITRPDGCIRWLLARGFPVHDESGCVYRVVGTVEDITESREREAQRRLLATALDGLGEGVCLMTLDGSFVYVNRRFRQFYEIGAGDAGHLRDCAFDEEARASQQEHLSMAATAGRWSGRVWRRPLNGGQEIPLDVVLERVDQGRDGPDLLFGIVSDATEQIEREQQLRWMERLASLGTLVGGVAHELNNPLNAVLNFAQLLAMDEADEERRGDLSTIQREAERMAKIVADLKQISRGVQQHGTDLSPTDLNELVEHVLKVQDYRLRTSNVLVTVELAGDLPPILADRAQIEQVVLNLVVNAEQAMIARSGEGHLLVRTRASARGATLEVIDDGPGIPPRLLERIFDPFFTTKPPGEGTGLGLSLVHSIVTEHGGEIRVESEIDSGSCFCVHLPRAPRACARAIPLPEHAAPRSLRILIVDDEGSIRRVLNRHLSRRGHSVDEAPEGGAALKLVEQHAYDVILSDLRMPGLGGEAMLERLRMRENQPRVVFMTGDAAGVGARQTRLEEPVLLKPVKLEDLTRVVEASGGG